MMAIVPSALARWRRSHIAETFASVRVEVNPIFETSSSGSRRSLREAGHKD